MSAHERDYHYLSGDERRKHKSKHKQHDKGKERRDYYPDRDSHGGNKEHRKHQYSDDNHGYNNDHTKEYRKDDRHRYAKHQKNQDPRDGERTKHRYSDDMHHNTDRDNRSNSRISSRFEENREENYDTHIVSDKEIAYKNYEHVSRDSKHSATSVDQTTSYNNGNTTHSYVTKFQSQSSESSSDSSDTDNDEIDWYDHKYTLNKIFFREDDFIAQNTSDYDDFWAFLDKYVIFERKKAMQNSGKKRKRNGEGKGLLDLPKKYAKRYRINLSLVTRDVEDTLQRQRKDKEKSKLTREHVTKFRSILLHYVNFCQKQKFSKLTKVRKDQRNLPIYKYKQHITEALEKNQVIVVAGDTGCGKSTQVPQYLLEAGYSKIACTQPRRIACISLSKRVAYETLNEYGSEVAYQVRFEKSKTQATRILFLTEGLLLRQITGDSLLSKYSVVIVDEVHERHLHTDCLLGVLRCLIQHREDLKIVLMSATINIDLFSGFFNNAPVIKVPGRLYPIQLEYCPISTADKAEKSSKLDPTPYIRIMQKIDHKYPYTERGDLLIFLSGMAEIMSVVEAAKMYAQATKRWIILPLHSSLSVAEQDKAFDIAPDGVRKCLVSTNIAETSVTIDGVRFVLDSGKVKEMSYDSKYKMQKLQEFWISRASAEQRKGRSGRTGPGVCFRLYAQTDYDAFQEYATPEIQRVPLDSLVLQMAAMGLPDARKFPFIEPPSSSSVENSVHFLKEQNALAEDETLTPLGQMLSQLPVDVVIGKMLIMGSIFHMIDPVMSIAAALSVQSPFTSKAHTDHDAISARKSLESDHGDPFTLLNAFDEWIQVKAEGRGTRKWCKRRGFEEQRFYEMSKLKQQFRDLLKDHNLLHKRETSPERPSTSEQRRKKHGERKRLRDLKRQQNNESRKRKILKLDQEEFGDYSSEEDLATDVKDLEFRLTHNLEKEQEKCNVTRSFTLRDINLLKVILCSGLYPQVALADDCNSFKADSEQAFHTKTKPFVLLHPTSIFASQPDLLLPNDLDGNKADNSRTVFSNKHELLTFVTLLETTKPYLTGTMRVPALQTLLLHAHHIDTNSACTRVICDEWLEIKFEDYEAAEEVLVNAVHLRNTWLDLLKLRLEDTVQVLDQDGEPVINTKAKKLERALAKKLSEFLAYDVKYSLRRVFAAEMQHMYIGPGGDNNADNDVIGDLMRHDSNGTPHPIKGGTRVNAYLTCGCLQDDSVASVYGEYTLYMQKHWTCSNCRQTMVVSVTERLQHEAACQKVASNTDVKGTDTGEGDKMCDELDPLRKDYHCSVCNGNFKFTTAEIFKHRKTCHG